MPLRLKQRGYKLKIKIKTNIQRAEVRSDSQIVENQVRTKIDYEIGYQKSQDTHHKPELNSRMSEEMRLSIRLNLARDLAFLQKARNSTSWG